MLPLFLRDKYFYKSIPERKENALPSRAIVQTKATADPGSTALKK